MDIFLHGGLTPKNFPRKKNNRYCLCRLEIINDLLELELLVLVGLILDFAGAKKKQDFSFLVEETFQWTSLVLEGF